MTAADDSVPPSEETRRLSAEKAREQLLADPLLRDAPVVEGFKVLEPAVLYAKVGAGGMGAVYRGRHFKLDLDVAVKCLKPALLQVEGDFVKRFEREARLAACIAHQNVVRVMDVQERNGLHYLVMEFVRGETAAERVKRKGPLPEKEALAILYGVTAGLAAAHQKGIVHRDLKPENVTISLDGEVKLADLGLAKSQGGIDGRSISMAASQIMGTPQYMPPEQWETTDVTAAADIWALGATFFYLVTGRTGISGAGTWQAVMKRVTEQPHPTLRQERPDLLPEVHALFERCVQRLPQDRFADARELLRELKKLAIDDDDAVLLDPATGSLLDRQGLVTPPPRETVLKIKAIVETEAAGRTTEPEPAGPHAPKSEDLTRQSPQPQRSRAGGWLLGLAATALLSAGGTYAAGLWPGGSGDATKGDNATPQASTELGNSSEPLVRELQLAVPFADRIGVDFEAVASAGTGYDGLPKRLRHRKTDLEFVLIPPGAFDMGSPPGEAGRKEDEALHRVTLTEPFYLAETEVSVAQWRGYAQATGYKTEAEASGKGGYTHRFNALSAGMPALGKITITNGDVITGLFKSMIDGKVIIISPLLGEVVVPMGSVGDMVTESQVSILTCSGDILIRRIVGLENGALRLEGDTTSLALDDLCGINAQGKSEYVQLTDAVWTNPLPNCNENSSFQLDSTQPVTQISWNDAMSFCRHYKIQLPTEAQWEYACRGGQAARFWWGDVEEQGLGKVNGADRGGDSRLINFADSFDFDDGFRFTAPVNRNVTPNAFGLKDMLGNVWEWCADHADSMEGKTVTNTYSGAVTDPLCLSGALRVSRGGCWENVPASCRSALRYCAAPSLAGSGMGFRPALVARPPAK